MPPSFLSRISRSNSGLVTDGPNHHQRMIRAPVVLLSMFLASRYCPGNPVTPRDSFSATRLPSVVWMRVFSNFQFPAF